MKTEKGWYCEECIWIIKLDEDKNKLGTTDFKQHMNRYKDGTPNWKQEKYEIIQELRKIKLKKIYPNKLKQHNNNI